MKGGRRSLIGSRLCSMPVIFPLPSLGMISSIEGTLSFPYPKTINRRLPYGGLQRIDPRIRRTGALILRPKRNSEKVCRQIQD